MKASFFIEVGGLDITGTFNPLATDISVTDASGEAADTASISIADVDGRVALPPIGDPISIGIGFGAPSLLFEGFVDDVTCAGSRSGRTMSISAKSADTVKGKLKEQSAKHLDDSTLGDAFQQWASDAGIGEAKVHSSLASIKRDYWSMDNESFMAWGQRMARKYGATFKVLGNRAVLVPRSAGISASGRPLQTIIARYGDNLKDYNIKPLLGRPQHAQTRSRHFDIAKAEWLEKLKEASYQTQASAIQTTRFTETDEGNADAKAGSQDKENDRERGGGSINIIGNPAAMAEAPCQIVGARPGVDGRYRIDSSNHTYNRGGGFNTSCTLKQPSEGAGTDSR